MLYSMKDITSWSFPADSVFILANSTDDRSMSVASTISQRQDLIQTVIILQYCDEPTDGICELFPSSEIIILPTKGTQVDFLCVINEYITIFEKASSLLLDISCIHTTELFTMLKFFRTTCSIEQLQVAYSVPFDYEFPGEPFLSYKSFYGDLSTKDLLGYGGLSDGKAHSQMIVFLGFEGALSSKVAEDMQYDNLILVNSLPPFFPKYKDYSIINNYQVLSSPHNKLKYVPANNPFDTYNFLSSLLTPDDRPCIAPLGTKPVALGVCLYALNHDSIRVVYPISDEYNTHNTHSTLETFIYEVPLIINSEKQN